MFARLLTQVLEEALEFVKLLEEARCCALPRSDTVGLHFLEEELDYGIEKPGERRQDQGDQQAERGGAVAEAKQTLPGHGLLVVLGSALEGGRDARVLTCRLLTLSCVFKLFIGLHVGLHGCTVRCYCFHVVRKIYLGFPWRPRALVGTAARAVRFCVGWCRFDYKMGQGEGARAG